MHVQKQTQYSIQTGSGININTSSNIPTIFPTNIPTKIPSVAPSTSTTVDTKSDLNIRMDTTDFPSAIPTIEPSKNTFNTIDPTVAPSNKSKNNPIADNIS